MPLFGQDATLQHTPSLSIPTNFFTPHVLGSGSGNYISNTPYMATTTEQVASQEKKDSLDLAASVGVGVGGGQFILGEVTIIFRDSAE
jgi:hypothetical protein